MAEEKQRDELEDPFKEHGFMEATLKYWHEWAGGHRNAIKKSTNVGCFYCGEISSATEVVEWIDDNQTGMCPSCGIDSIIPDSLLPELDIWHLRAMYDKWFGIGHGVKKDPETGKSVIDEAAVLYRPRSW